MVGGSSYRINTLARKGEIAGAPGGTWAWNAGLSPGISWGRKLNVESPCKLQETLLGFMQQLVGSVMWPLSLTYAKLFPHMESERTDHFLPNRSPMALWLSSGVPLVLTS